MKEPKPRTKRTKMLTTKTAKVNSKDLHAEKILNDFGEIGRMASAEYSIPTTEKIAELAAALARSPDDDPSKLADAAIKLWETVGQKLRQRMIEKKMRTMAEEFRYDCPACFPVRRDDFLRFELPRLKYCTGELAKVAKAYAKSVIEENLGNSREATPEEVSSYYANWKTIETPSEYSMASLHFSLWWNDYHKTELVKVRRAAGKKSAQVKEKRKARPPSEKSKSANLPP